MMAETSKDFYGYARDNSYQAVDVPYSLGEVSMTILLPDEGTFGEFEDSLNAYVLDRILDDIEINYVTLTMPLFKFESEFDLGKTLAGMGTPCCPLALKPGSSEISPRYLPVVERIWLLGE